VFAMSLAFATEQSVIDHYNRSCISCHASGAAKAPRSFVPADWAPRLSKGSDQLVLSVKKGLNAMPPKGMCYDCTDEDFKALIEYMSAARK
jgi:cytochrome c5